MPGAATIPGGHLERGERPEDALHREVLEELGVAVKEAVFVCTLLDRSVEFRRVHYFGVIDWQNDVVAHEAESVHWVNLEQYNAFDLDVDRTAVREFMRLYRRR
jgi:8-oxo-dGTP diphosphatase